MKVIDSHHHFWRYGPAEYGWIGEGMGLLRRDFGPGELKAEMEASGVDAAISVQARQTVEETAWLLGFASEEPWIAGVVGWLPLADENVASVLERFSGEEKLVGVRHIVQDEPDDDYILSPAFNRGVARLAGYGLAYDILIYQRHLRQAVAFVDRHPEQVFVLDHAAKPVIGGRPEEEWRAGISELARRENVFCKISGMVTEVRGKDWDGAVLRPYVECVLEAFGARRVLYGSDWPVCLLRSNYGRWAGAVRGFVSELSESEQEGVMGGNAARVYRTPRISGDENEGSRW